jgi:hypothetical protein
MLKHKFLALLVLLALFAPILAACLAKGSATPVQQKTAQPTQAHPAPAVTQASRLTPTPFFPQSPDPSPAASEQAPLPTASGSAVPSNQPPDAGASLPNTQYNLTAELNYDQHHLAVTELITYTNHTSEALNDLVLMVDPMYYPGAFMLKNLAWADGQQVENGTAETGRLHLPLRQPLAPAASLGLSLSYELSLPSPTPDPQTRPVPFGYTANQTNLVDWYPFVAPYVPGKGWLAHPAGYFGEHLVY